MIADKACRQGKVSFLFLGTVLTGGRSDRGAECIGAGSATALATVGTGAVCFLKNCVIGVGVLSSLPFLPLNRPSLHLFDVICLLVRFDSPPSQDQCACRILDK